MPKRKKGIYLDHAAATPMADEVIKAMEPYYQKKFGNASAIYRLGTEAKAALDNARKTVARVLGSRQDEIIFTGSGTESDNLALFGMAEAHKDRGRHIIISSIEHKAVLEPAQILEKSGFEITYLKVDRNGLVDIKSLEKALRKDTILVSIIYANNEIGVIQPIKKIAGIIKNFKKENVIPALHTDACQAAGALPLKVNSLGVDLLTLNGSKIYGPKGIGCLYVASKIKIKPVIVGGEQENRLRAGTEAMPLIIGFAKALELSERLRVKESKRLIELREYFLEKLKTKIDRFELNGHPEKRLPNNISVAFHGVEGESLVLMLDKYGICAATGSACASFDLSPSHVILATGLGAERAHETIRLTLGRDTTKQDLDYVLKILSLSVAKLRQISSSI